MDNEELIDVLNTLIETSKDGELGFRTCAEQARSPTLRTLLQRRADECQQAALELQALVRQYGGEPETQGSISGAMHRGWVAARARLASVEDEAILEEAERGEDIALRRYADAIAEPLPADVHVAVRRHLEGVTRNHDQIRRLRDQLIA
ncbi:PA2169 family four-helix-bundle protein [Aquincola sp. S2]|uniref:PA2169 family four-helix-bundle protein n=1 Tax=Pseudaquabacterium terrae TaxID=2732868 RepID=A0ABX2EHW2_9BURK|nr:PA2169 family four-helix-bundle protein [Aquabacterium terrae]NRF68161.1 PA2169 family four-helix-bundle protein [Aquabacterium terrae]